MQQGIELLFKQGSLVSIVLAILICALVMFATFTRKLITEQLKLKDDRISALERDVKELQEFNRTELVQIITNSNKIMQKAFDTFERVEDTLLQFKKDTK